ncbi:hypothetical protein [Aphanothece hegewaldii]|nr:hypothetical protein [Aphanothece hegewaldii]
MTNSYESQKASKFEQDSIIPNQPKIRVYQLSLKWAKTEKNKLNIIYQT